ncbi:MAG TPA: sodium:proton exchanger, partial [Lachnospiraceae bacterium]|nr:sodium:proton exchanger [Lachnospiraceae bacterium]
TIVAMGTSLPECSVSINASIAGSNGLAISNAVGSNIFNLMMVCGFCALFSPLAVDSGTLKKEFPFSMAVSVIMLVLGLAGMALGHMDGIILLIIFIAFLYWMVSSAKKARTSGQQEEDGYEIIPVWKCIFYIAGGAAAIIVGGDVVVDSATKIAHMFKLSDNLIGLTIVAMGTSLPELVTSVVAAKKNEADLAFGNVIGSNIFNVLFVLGIASAISPIGFSMENFIDAVILVAMSIAVWIFSWSKHKIERGEGIVMLLMYAAYMVYICKR